MQAIPENIDHLAVSRVSELLERPDFLSFVRKAHSCVRKSQHACILSVTLQIESLDALAVLEWLGRGEEFQFFWEYPDGNLAVAAGGVVKTICDHSEQRFKTVSRQLNDIFTRHHHYTDCPHTLSGLQAFGGFAFQHHRSELWKSFPAAKFVIPKWTFVKEGKLGLVTLNKEIEPDSDVDDYLNFIQERAHNVNKRLLGYLSVSESIKFNPSQTSGASPEVEEQWNSAVKEAKSDIEIGQYQKIVLARRQTLIGQGHPKATQVLNELRNRYPSSYSFLCQFDGEGSFIGSTPERLISTFSNIVLTEALAGSVARGKSASEDALNERKLLRSEKDRREHHFVVEAIRAALQPFALRLDIGTHPEIKKFANVQHLRTSIKAVLRESERSGVAAIDLLSALHPTPAVGGFPPSAVVNRIYELEQINRGWYSGPIGWVMANGRSEFSVAIRSALIQDKKVHLFAGCGIVDESNAESEWKETELKFLPMIEAFKAIH